MVWRSLKQDWRRLSTSFSSVLSSSSQRHPLAKLAAIYVLLASGAVLFIVFWLKSQAIDSQNHSQYLNKIRQLQELDARINQDVLEARLGFLPYYDPFVEEIDNVKKLHQALEQYPDFVTQSAQRKLQLQLQGNIQLWQEKDALIQQFKSEHAILRNSLAYFPIAIADLATQPGTSPTLSSDLDDLLNKILLFNLSTDEKLAPKIQADIDRLRSQSSNNADLANVIAHAEIIVENRLKIDQLVETILVLPTRKQGETLAATYDLTYQRAIRSIDLYRLGLYLMGTIFIFLTAASSVLKIRENAAALEQSKTQLRNIFDNTQVGIFRTRLTDGLVLEANQYFVSILGYDNINEVVGIKKSVEFYADEKVRQGVLETVLQTGVVHNVEAQFCRQDNSLCWVLFSCRLNKAGNCLDKVIADISDRKQAEADLQKAMKEAQAANQAKSQFLSNMSHELRTPLNVILGFAQLMSRSGSLNSPQQQYIHSINQSGEHLLNLINDVLEMSKIEAGKINLNLSDFNLHNLLDGIYLMFQARASSKNIQLKLHYSENLPQYIHSDESKLRQVLVNLVGNAVKFTESGYICLNVWLLPIESEDQPSSTSNTSKTQPMLRFPVVLQFEVEDTGPGIAAEQLEHLFEPFVQAESGQANQEGTGLGLPISRKFVELMGGKLTVTSRLSQGSRFCFTIRAEAIAPDEVALSTSNRPVTGLQPNQPTYRILIAEDMPQNRQVLVDLLKPIGFEIREATNGLEAVLIWQHWLPHLIWMDLRMPVMDGYEATKQIKAIGEHAPTIIAITGSAFEEDRAVALAAGCDDFVRKPFRAEVIFEKMAEFLGVQYVYGDAIAPSKSPPMPSRDVNLSITTMADLQMMSETWRQQLHEAATKVNAREVSHLIQQIPTEQAASAAHLTQLVENFNFEEIVALAQDG